MKNLKTISLTVMGTIAILGTSVLASTGKVNAPSGLILREKASTDGEVITTVPNEAEVNVVEKEGQWYKAIYNDHEGYLFGEYVELEETVQNVAPEQQQPETQTSTDKTTAQGKLKVYAIPVITSTVISEIEAKTEIKVEKQITNWSYISSGEVTGWVRTYGIENKVETNVQPEAEETPENVTENTETNLETPEQSEEEPAVENEETNQEATVTTQPSNNAQTETQVEASKAFVKVEYANIRKTASTDSEIVTTLTRDTSFTITAETEEWYKIKYTSPEDVVYEGYIFKDLVTK